MRRIVVDVTAAERADAFPELAPDGSPPGAVADAKSLEPRLQPLALADHPDNIDAAVFQDREEPVAGERLPSDCFHQDGYPHAWILLWVGILSILRRGSRRFMASTRQFLATSSHPVARGARRVRRA